MSEENREEDDLVRWLREDPRRHSDAVRDEIAEELGVTRAELDEALEEDARAWMSADADAVFIFGLEEGPVEWDDFGQPIPRRAFPPPVLTLNRQGEP